MGFIRSIFFFAAWGSWWGFYLGALCGTLILPIFGTVLAAQVGLVMGVVAGILWGAFMGLVIGPLAQATPLARTQARRTWAIIAMLVGGLGTSVITLVSFFGWLPRAQEGSLLVLQLSLGAALWGALALADATTRYMDRMAGHPDPLRPFGGPLSSSYFFFMEAGAPLRMTVALGLSLFLILLNRCEQLSGLLDVLLSMLYVTLPFYSLWALLNGVFLGLLNRLVFVEYFQDMPHHLYRSIVMGISLGLTLGSALNMIYITNLNPLIWPLLLLILTIATLVTSHAYANAYYAGTGSDKKGKHQPAEA